MPPKVLQREALCPSCDRYIGPVDVCPYCDTDSYRNPAFRVLRGASVVLALLGVACLLLMVRGSPRRVVRTSDVTPFMNYAYVRMAGRVPREPYARPGGGSSEYLSFLLDDGSGRVRVAASGRVADRLRRSGRIPDRGDFVDVCGCLAFSPDGRPSLRLQSEEAVRIRKTGEGEPVPR